MQGFKKAGRINVGYTTPGSPLWWRDVLTCTICGALVFGTADDAALDPGSDPARHARWHKETGTYAREP